MYCLLYYEMHLFVIFGKNVNMKKYVNMNINRQYYNYTLIISPCLTFHII